MQESNETLCVGIDLGTSRSSISASNGERHVIDSYDDTATGEMTAAIKPP